MAGFDKPDDWPEACAIVSTRKDVVAGYRPRFVGSHTEANAVHWFEGKHERIFSIANVSRVTPDLFRFRDQEGATHTLFAMTLERYERFVRPHTIGRPRFSSLRALLDAMRNEW